MTGSFHQFEAPPAGPPSIEGEGATNVTEHDATIEAQINPNGAYTGYEFQIDTNGSFNVPRAACPFDLPGYGECEVLITGEPLSAGLVEPSSQYISARSGGHAVSLDLASIGVILRPATTYHYRVLAQNGGNPSVSGPDQTFTTTTAAAAVTPLLGQGGSSQSSDLAGQAPTRQASPASAPIHRTTYRRRRYRHQLHRRKHVS